MAVAMAGSQALKRLELRDAEALFEAHGAEEIRGLERQVRAEIEHKKEELRQMVGERYRDLIEAADTIGQMRCCAEGLLDAVRATDQCCARLRQQSHATSTATASATTMAASRSARTPQPSQEKFYSMAAQIKLLLEIPEKIWSSMEASQYLHATQLYLLCCHLHGLLRLDSSSGCYSPVLARFPILVRQVAAASHFRSTILHETKMILRCQAVSDQAVAEALSSVMLLEDSSPRQALTDFLLARKAAIQHLLNQPHHGAGIKAQICSLVELLATTLYQAHALFYTLPEGVLPDPALPCGLLFSTLDSVTSQQLAGKGIINVLQEMKLCSWFKHLPASIMEFQPTLRTLAHPINEEYLKDTLQKWINMCHEDIKTGITNLLVYVKSLKGLAGIRDAVWELLTSESMSQSWEVVCRRLLDKPISFWEDLLQQLFLDRLQTLTRDGFDSISSSSKKLLVSALQELEASSSTSPNKQVQFEHNMSLFLWSESPSDLPSDAAWVNVANRSQCASSGLSMKAQALSPYVQSFCLALDSKLKVKLDDLLSYLPSDAPKEASGAQTKNSAFDRYSDASTVEGMLRNHCAACTEQIVACVRAELQGAEAALQGPTHMLSRPKLSSVLFMARLCQSLGELCPHLKRCILGKSGSSEKPIREPRATKKQAKGKAQEVNPVLAKWQEVKEQLLEQSLLGYRLWSMAITNVLVRDFTQSLLLGNAGSILAMATNWDELEIQEETETGSSVTSKIRLPVQKEGTFPMTQNRALQLLYDLRYLNIVLTVKTEEVKSARSKQDSRIEKVTDFLEGLIDPFDLDVFTPHLNSNLNRLVQRTSVLFGLLTGTDNQFSARSSTFNSQEPHNILPLASSQIRFGLLPLSTTSTRKAKSSSRSTESKDQVVLPTLPRADDVMMRPGSLFRQAVTEEEDTSTPSSRFTLSWLANMTK
ncbi:conserved oligomeric Golgi complex subunit 1 isoform X2 [Monodelphis domestica]|uniref:conserved oligomeric Golgi complex subunit 1 isoform X2 n=1 Tax=Monodelphis domestica TaxID=13616 RepID=UPI0024E1CA06|nr:conserved oligomeric Golgi complex subunit 1 isoform X2 [Monodelphis domestica]